MAAAPPHHSLTLRVYYEDTDFSGFVYHASYLRFLERGRTEYLRAAGVDQSRLFREEGGLAFVVARLAIDYRRPALMDDLIEVRTTLDLLRGPVLVLRQEIVREATALVSARVTVACVRQGRPTRLPATLRAALGA